MSENSGFDKEITAALARTIDRAREVAAHIKRAADQLAVANTVLETRLPGTVQVGEVAQALEHADAVQKALASSADFLEQVNVELANVATRIVDG